MKSLLPWFYVVAAFGSQSLYAAGASGQPEEGMVDYRQGDYFHAAQNLIKYNQASHDEPSNPLINYYLGRMRLYGYGLLKSNDLALRYLTKAGDQGLLIAEQWLAKYYLQINKPDLALNWFKKAAAQADYDAQMYSAAAYLFGYGTPKNPDAARRYYIDAARSGNVLAQYTLAMDFLSSRDGTNRKMGVIWLIKAADKGYPEAQYQLGELYLAGNGVTRDPLKAEALLNQAAEKGVILAQIAMGKLFADSKGTRYDPTRALQWMKKAALANNVEAEQALAGFYKAGQLVPADEKRAEEWQEKAKANLALKSNQPDTPASLVAAWLSHDESQSFAHTVYGLGGIFSAWNNKAALQENNYNPSPKMHRISRQELYKPAFVLASPKEIPINDYFDFLAPTIGGREAGTWSFPLYPIDAQIQALLDSQSPVLAKDTWQSPVDDGRTYPVIAEDSVNYFDKMTTGWQIKANFQQVLTYLYYRAILGDADAQFKLGQLYEYGIVVAKNSEQSIIYYELAALQQDVRAEYNQ